MTNFKHKTRGNSSPQGKPRVYFCCHTDDFDRYFESVSNEILAKQNCAIWYNDEAVVRDEDFFADLKQMQLFVMPVTTNLLCTENKALDTEFKFAIENHIPVLPLMQESGLEKLFNQKCGDLQYLDKQDHDITAISYDEKLQKYLESVLIGDELAEKIRAAFDAYVFLSYRKKDRRYAQELMRLIHKNEFCRDIAIWYDEFLTPGENFNDSIKEALQKSGLFVLTVTPNLVIEPNYIMTTEYPMAKQEGKPILPAELIPTDREQLSEKYEDIPNPADAHNETELSEALLEAVKKMAIKENDNSPEHTFFIGLAYFNGIDVEVDREKAIEIIRKSANANCLTAIKFLATCYKVGNGVNINHQAYVDWEEKLIYAYQDEFHTTNASDSGYKLVYELLNYSQDLLDWCYIDESISVASTALKEIKNIKDASEFHLWLLCACYECIADSYFRKDLRISDQYYFLLQCIFEKELESIDEKDKSYYMCKLCSCLIKRYDIAKMSANEDSHIINKLFELINSDYLDCSNVEVKRNISLVLEREGNRLISEELYSEAKKMFQKKRDIDRLLYDETKHLNDLRNETIAIERLGDIEALTNCGSIDIALNNYNECLEKTNFVVQHTKSIESFRDLAIIHDKIGSVYISAGLMEKSFEHYLESYKIRKELHDKVKSVQTMEDYAISCYNVGKIIKNKEILEYALEIFSTLAISTNRKLWHNKIIGEIQNWLKKLQ